MTPEERLLAALLPHLETMSDDQIDEAIRRLEHVLAPRLYNGVPESLDRCAATNKTTGYQCKWPRGQGLYGALCGKHAKAPPPGEALGTRDRAGHLPDAEPKEGK